MVERIRILLESRQLTPTQFADLIGVARPIISHVLSGRNKPSLEVVQRILAAMPDLSMAWLLNGTEPMLTVAREAAPAAPVPRSAEPVASPLPAAPPQPVAPGVAALPVVPMQGVQNFVKQEFSDVGVTAEPILPLVPMPAVSNASPAAVLATANLVPAARPANTASSRPPMPRRFPVKPPPTELPASAASSQTPAPPALPFPVGSPVATATASIVPAAPAATIEAVVSNIKLIEIEQIEPVVGVATETLATPTPVPAPTPGPGATPDTAPTLASDMALALFTGAEKPIRRIVIFYRDGSFADYQPE